MKTKMVLNLEPGNVEAQNEVKKIKEVSVKCYILGFDLLFQLVFSFYLLAFSGCFQILGSQAPATSSEATQPQEAPTIDPEHQRRQEAVIQKDRVSVAMPLRLQCPSWSSHILISVTFLHFLLTLNVLLTESHGVW